MYRFTSPVSTGWDQKLVLEPKPYQLQAWQLEGRSDGAMKYKKQLNEALDTIEDLKDKLRESLAKRKKLIKKLGESQELIEKLEEQSGFEESEEAISELMTENEKLIKRVKAMKREQEHSC